MKKTSSIAVAVALLIGLSVWAFSKNQDKAPNQKVALAQCLTDEGVKFYGAWWCSACKQQKVILGARALAKVEYIECTDANKNQTNEECNEGGISSYPTWRHPDGREDIKGPRQFEELAEWSGCAWEDEKEEESNILELVGDTKEMISTIESATTEAIADALDQI